MKIKEKGLTGKAAVLRKQQNTTGGRTGFNAFHEMDKERKGGAKGKGKDKDGAKPKPEVWLEFMGTKLRVHDEDGGTVREEDVPHVKGSALKFTGCGGDVKWEEIKVRCDVRTRKHWQLTSLLETTGRALLAPAFHQICARG